MPGVFVQYECHSREGGNPQSIGLKFLDARLHRHDTNSDLIPELIF